MGAAVTGLATGFVLVAGSTVITNPALAWAQGILGVVYTFSGAVAGWKAARA